ncbi:MAG: hypothetical protein AAF787_19360, partial [Chloroflexota bacterium]
MAPLLLLLTIAAACSSAPPVAPVPTLTLIPATPTLTPTAGRPSATIPPRIDPDTIAATSTPTAAGTPVDDPVAQELLGLAVRRVVNTADVDADDVEVVSIEVYRWLDGSLGCPLPDT